MRTADPNRTVTPRQLELIALVASGYTYAEIGEMKFLSYHGVRNSLVAAVKRTEARNVTHLAVLCMESGLIYRNGSDDYKPIEFERVVSE